MTLGPLLLGIFSTVNTRASNVSRCHVQKEVDSYDMLVSSNNIQYSKHPIQMPTLVFPDFPGSAMMFSPCVQLFGVFVASFWGMPFLHAGSILICSDHPMNGKVGGCCSLYCILFTLCIFIIYIIHICVCAIYIHIHNSDTL